MRELALYFLKLGALGFGGPVALANYMRRDFVELRRWLTEREYAEGLAIATACPGPLAYQLGIYCGYVRQGVLGGIIVAIAFGLPPGLTSEAKRLLKLPVLELQLPQDLRAPRLSRPRFPGL